MPKRIVFPREICEDLNTIVDRLKLAQKELVVGTDLSLSWTSNALNLNIYERIQKKGKDQEKVERKVEGDKLATLIEVLAGKMSKSTRFSEEEKNALINRLRPFNINIASSLKKTEVRPGASMTPEARYYIHRPEEDILLRVLQGLPTSSLVTGPPQSGISTLLNRLLARAHEVGIATCFYDPLAEGVDSRLERGEDPIAVFVDTLYSALQTGFGFNPGSSSPSSIPALRRWINEEVRGSRGAFRLLVIDKIDIFGSRFVEELCALFARAFTNDRGNLTHQIGLAIGMSYQYGTGFDRHLLEVSSMVAWQPRIQLDWFLRNQIKDLKLEFDGVYNYFNGQPYLTMSLLHDEKRYSEFKDLVIKWEGGRKEGYDEYIRNSYPYMVHYRAIGNAFFGRSSENTEAEIVNALSEILKYGQTSNNDVGLFFEHIQFFKNGNFTTPIYRLMAEDILRSS